MPAIDAAIIQNLAQAFTKDQVKRFGVARVQKMTGDRDPGRAKVVGNAFGTLVTAVGVAAKRGEVSPITLATAIVTNGGGIADLSNNDKLQCFGAMLDLGGQGLSQFSQIAVVGAEECGSGGLAIPLVVGQAALGL